MTLQKYALIASLYALLATSFQSCTNGSLNFISKKSPHAEYQQKLTSSGLHQTTGGQQWIEASKAALANPMPVPITSIIKGLVKPKEIKALAWSFDAAKGATISLSINWLNKGEGRIFIDMFLLAQDDPLLSLSNTDSITRFEFKKTGTYVIRLQPELFAEGQFQLTLRQERTYAVFPVYGKGSSSIHSFWGAPRGGGSRTHEGIDIFAAKGTPVIAPVGGVVGSVRNRGLGGKQVWLRDTERGYNLYFAHLDSQAVNTAQLIRAGDTLGFVGNTGNARFTPPHLHFGIYDGGAFDPLHMVQNNFEAPKTTDLPLTPSVQVITTPNANVRQGPGTEYNVAHQLIANNPVLILAAVQNWYHIQTPDSKQGYVHQSLVKPPKPQPLPKDTAILFTEPFLSSDSLSTSTNGFVVLGQYQGYQMISDTLENRYYILK